ncbi:MAG: class I SAM-dependent methyltransferase [Chitinophagaceae bacterium]
MVKQIIKKYINKLPYFKTLAKESEQYKELVKEIDIYKTTFPPGHYYSPIIAKEEIAKRANEIFSIKSNKITGVNLNEEEQVDLLNKLAENYSALPFSEEEKSGLRYYYNNNFYCHSDAIFLSLIIQHFKPGSIIEVGSGYSSAVMLDTNELFFDNKIKITFIEPYPEERLFKLFKPADKINNQTLISNLQDTNLDLFDKLNANDILFIDSTHVSKTGSDVNHILFEILPGLKSGVLVHFHDIFYPFEYPKDWVLKWNGFGWNESYILKAFLMHNDDYKILMFNTFLEHFHKDWFEENMPLCLENEGGSIWIQKL